MDWLGTEGAPPGTRPTAHPLHRLLAKHPKVAKVIYPGLATHPQHLLAANQMSQRYDGMVTAVLKGGLPASKRFIVRLSVEFESIDDLLAELEEALS